MGKDAGVQVGPNRHFLKKVSPIAQAHGCLQKGYTVYYVGVRRNLTGKGLSLGVSQPLTAAQ